MIEEAGLQLEAVHGSYEDEVYNAESSTRMILVEFDRNGIRKRFKGGDRTMSKADITSWDENILQVSVPMDSPLRQVNSYILPDEDGRITIIDPGPRSPETEKCWQAILQELGLSWKDVRDIVVTHHHPDHYGLAGWLQLQTGCKVWMTERAHAEAMLMWGSDTDINEVLPLYFIDTECRKNGRVE